MLVYKLVCLTHSFGIVMKVVHLELGGLLSITQCVCVVEHGGEKLSHRL